MTSLMHQAIRLTPTSYLVLGMVRVGATSGYAIKKAADKSTQSFWPTSLAGVYPELTRLTDAGFLTKRSDPQGGRARSAYAITKKGEEALRAWLLSPRMAPVQMRDEAMLRFFFADVLSSEDQLELVGRLRERNREGKDYMRNEIVPLAENLESAGARFPAAGARVYAGMFGYVERWLARFEAKLEKEKG